MESHVWCVLTREDWCNYRSCDGMNREKREWHFSILAKLNLMLFVALQPLLAGYCLVLLEESDGHVCSVGRSKALGAEYHITSICNCQQSH